MVCRPYLLLVLIKLEIIYEPCATYKNHAASYVYNHIFVTLEQKQAFTYFHVRYKNRSLLSFATLWMYKHFSVLKNLQEGHLMFDFLSSNVEGSCSASAQNFKSSFLDSSLTCALFVSFFNVRGQHIAQTPTPASVLHAPGRSECRQQLCLWSLIQSPQLLQLLRHFHEPLSIQQPHEPRRQRALPTGQSKQGLPQYICKRIYNVPTYR